MEYLFSHVKIITESNSREALRIKAEFERCEENGIYEQRAKFYPNTNNKFQLFKKSLFLCPSFPSVKWKAANDFFESVLFLCSEFPKNGNLILGNLIFMFDNLLHNLLLTSDSQPSAPLCKARMPLLADFKILFKMPCLINVELAGSNSVFRLLQKQKILKSINKCSLWLRVPEISSWGLVDLIFQKGDHSCKWTHPPCFLSRNQWKILICPDD